MSDNNYVGWDIGGAHLKMASVSASGTVMQVEQHATPLWQGLDCLESTLIDVKTRLPVDNMMTHAITTTGELSDLFYNRKEGVGALLTEFCKVFNSEQVKVYAGPAGLLSVTEANSQYELVASANWHASANYVASQQTQGIFIDIGTTTTDFVPFQAGKLCHRGYTDQQRMRYDELLYTGIVRTPVMAVVSKVPFAGEWQTLAAENFATMADVYRLTGELDECHDLMPAADGGGKQVQDSARRLARMLGSDVDDMESLDEYRKLAEYIAEEHIHKIDQALQRVISANNFPSKYPLTGAGAGRFLVVKLAERHAFEYVDIEQILSVENDQRSRAADCATAVSVAQIRRLLG